MRSNPPSCRGKSNPFNSIKGDVSTGCIPSDDPLGAEVLEGLIDDGARILDEVSEFLGEYSIKQRDVANKSWKSWILE
eukprot:1096773-Pyramimonas_sp.AAC.1